MRLANAFGADRLRHADQDLRRRDKQANALQPRRMHGGTRVVEASSPNPKTYRTSYVERQNLTMRMHMRRFTRLTNAFSKKMENHIAAISLHFMYYNFVRIHQTLRVTPAMAAGVTIACGKLRIS